MPIRGAKIIILKEMDNNADLDFEVTEVLAITSSKFLERHMVVS